MLNMLLWIGRMNDSNFFLKTDIDSEVLIFSLRLNQSLKAEGKKELCIVLFLVSRFTKKYQIPDLQK